MFTSAICADDLAVRPKTNRGAFSGVATLAQPGFWTEFLEQLNGGRGERIFRTGILSTLLALILTRKPYSALYDSEPSHLCRVAFWLIPVARCGDPMWETRHRM